MKNKIAILTDTNSGLSPEWAELYGIYMVPMPVVINNETYFEHNGVQIRQNPTPFNGNQNLVKPHK